MPRRSRSKLISQKKVRSSIAEPKPSGDMSFPEPGARGVAAWRALVDGRVAA